MEFAVLPALIAGFVATVIMSMLMTMARTMGMTEMPGMPLFIGSMMSPEVGKARMIGLVIHYLLMGTILFGLVYVWLFREIGSAGWLAGGLIGLVHGVVFGLMLPLMAKIHPRVSRQQATVEASAAQVEGGEMESPGMFGVNWGAMTPVGLVLGHVVFGVVLALVYSAIV